MIDFIMHAIPVAIIAVSVVLIFMSDQKAKKSENAKELSTHMALGACFGMAIGVMVSVVLHFNLGLCMCVGVLAGEAVALNIK